MILLNERYLYILWKDNLPSKSMNVYRVVGNIDYSDGKFVFKIPNGSIVSINADQIITIGLSEMKEWGGQCGKNGCAKEG